MNVVESFKAILLKPLALPANLVAYACKVSFDKGYEGFLSFDAKTTLIKHYGQSLGATHFSGTRNVH